MLIGAGAQVYEPLLHPFDFGDAQLCQQLQTPIASARVPLLGLSARERDVLVQGVLDCQVFQVISLGWLNAVAEVDGTPGRRRDCAVRDVADPALENHQTTHLV
ncbi:hypothetical protein ASC97_21270 [Rhizobium sp. Root1203]|nr:hypothetical protein ASC97_21270 [Rhizobium sp. Root1203]